MQSRKKILPTLCILIFFSEMCFAEQPGSRFAITQSEEEFDIICWITDDMTVNDVIPNNDVSVTQDITLQYNGVSGKLIYSLFTDTGGSEDSFSMDYTLWVLMCACNASGYNLSPSQFSTFRNEDVANEFNGDLGCTIFVQNPQSEYAQGYNYLMMEFFYKANQGLVMRSFLFNDTAFLGLNADGTMQRNSLYERNYHSFCFMERDKNGQYIIP